MVTEEDNLEVSNLVVDAGLGQIIGSFLRQMACRGEPNWQIIGYKLTPKSEGFGITGGHHFSYLEVLKGKLVIENGKTEAEPFVATFSKQGSDYIFQDMKIVGLGHLTLPTIDVALYYGFGLHSVEDNYEIVSRIAESDVNNFIILPSVHGDTCVFTYTVTSEELGRETICIRASKGAVERSLKHASSCLEKQLQNIL